MSLKTYQQAQASTESPRQTEYRLFAEITHGLIGARDRGVRDSAFNEALDKNRQLWSVLSTDCGVPGNALPKELRAGIISLSIWVSKHTSQVMRGADDDIDVLISVNKTIMEGLAIQPTAPTGGTPAGGEATPGTSPTEA